ncbi:aspartate aminotransferase family protein [Epibacterium sp. Ofav1-8]|uniref:aspartate aminotransferase family protein n=1 Tax=Epibacterium sp. Ofav1-8 TaxID=2917735 RepID=UPI001EF57162|nr:aminotransferase class III-fold pyridoxal phosphate-dependent enzyme [Epibacterium sp. Ofav1-8]MCG7625092.1 aminotransferase class III-fold pyridoxal phosphate-dependent enzyme [Epibacterium sp. Ofav1-8]
MPVTSEIEQAVAELEQRYSEANPESLALHRRAQAAMPGGNTRTALHFDPFPLYVVRSTGSRVTDVDGHSYIDALGEFSAGLYGHKEPAILAAAQRALELGASNGAPGASEIDLAEVVCARFPAIEQVRFCNSGTEANLYALQLARHATGRNKLMAFHGAYHGGVFVFSDVDNAMNAPFDWVFGRYNDIEGSVAMIREQAQDLAAVIVEPMMSNAGSLPASRDFLRGLRAACDECGVLLIFDEVVTSRIGAGGMQALYDVMPDLTTLGKYLGAGFSFGAFGGRVALMAHMDPSRPGALPHAGTFNNNLFTMLAGHAGLTQVFTPARAVQLTEAGDALRARLNAVVRESNAAAQFTGLGSIMNLHFTGGEIHGPEDLREVPRLTYKLFQLEMILSGVYLARRSQINMSLAISPEDADHIVESVRAFFKRWAHLI